MFCEFEVTTISVWDNECGAVRVRLRTFRGAASGSSSLSFLVVILMFSEHFIRGAFPKCSTDSTFKKNILGTRYV